MKIMLVAATTLEIAPFVEQTRSKTTPHRVLITGIGMLAAGIQLTKAIYTDRPDLIVQAGIAGCFDTNLPLSTSFVVGREYFGDLGVVEAGSFQDLFDLGLESADGKHFTQKSLVNEHVEALNKLNLPVVSAITVNEISTDRTRIDQLKNKYNPTLESMEGAALHYAAMEARVPFVQLRTSSNYVGERDKSRWALKDSITALNNTLALLFNALEPVDTQRL